MQLYERESFSQKISVFDCWMKEKLGKYELHKIHAHSGA